MRISIEKGGVSLCFEIDDERFLEAVLKFLPKIFSGEGNDQKLINSLAKGLDEESDGLRASLNEAK